METAKTPWDNFVLQSSLLWQSICEQLGWEDPYIKYSLYDDSLLTHFPAPQDEYYVPYHEDTRPLYNRYGQAVIFFEQLIGDYVLPWFARNFERSDIIPDYPNPTHRFATIFEHEETEFDDRFWVLYTWHLIFFFCVFIPIILSRIGRRVGNWVHGIYAKCAATIRRTMHRNSENLALLSYSIWWACGCVVYYLRKGLSKIAQRIGEFSGIIASVCIYTCTVTIPNAGTALYYACQHPIETVMTIAHNTSDWVTGYLDFFSRSAEVLGEHNWELTYEREVLNPLTRIGNNTQRGFEFFLNTKFLPAMNDCIERLSEQIDALIDYISAYIDNVFDFLDRLDKNQDDEL